MKKLLARAGIVGVPALALSSVASAAVPAWASAILTDLTADAAAFMTSLSAIFVIFVVGFLWFKILNKGVSKVT